MEYIRRLARPTSLSTTPNMMIMSTNMTAGLAKGAQAAEGFSTPNRISPAAAHRAVTPMGMA
jgi:hypothetical protein